MDLERSLKKVGRDIAGLFGSEQTPDILDTLKKEHDEVGDMLKRLVDSASVSERRSLVKKIKAVLIPHMKAEQKVVYDAVIALRPKDAKTHGEEGYIEHKLAAEALQLLGKISNAASPEFLAAAKVLKELIRGGITCRRKSATSGPTCADAFRPPSERAAMNKRFDAGEKARHARDRGTFSPGRALTPATIQLGKIMRSVLLWLIGIPIPLIIIIWLFTGHA